VLKIAIMSKTFETFVDNNCIIIKTENVKIIKYSMENKPTVLVIIRNQKVNPAETAKALNLGEESSILNRINKSYQTTLGKDSQSHHSY